MGADLFRADGRTDRGIDMTKISQFPQLFESFYRVYCFSNAFSISALQQQRKNLETTWTASIMQQSAWGLRFPVAVICCTPSVKLDFSISFLE